MKLYFKEVGSIFAFSVTKIKIGDQNDEKQKSHKSDIYKGQRLALIWLSTCYSNSFYWSKLFGHHELTLI